MAIKQRPGESLQAYFERVGENATEAFTDDDFKNNDVKQQLTDIYVDGLSNKHLVRQSSIPVVDIFPQLQIQVGILYFDHEILIRQSPFSHW